MALLSVDLGRTATKACVGRNPEEAVIIPSNVAPVGVDRVRQGSFEAGFAEPLWDIWLEYQGGGYALGQLAADFGADLGVGQSKVEDALVKVLACAGHFRLSGRIAAVLGLPYLSQEQFDREKEQMFSLLRSPHIFSYRGKAVAVELDPVWVVPEGYGSFVWTEACAGSAAELLGRSVAVIDIGHQTTDLLTIDRFRFARAASRSDDFAMDEFYRRVAKNIPGADSQSLALIEAVNRPEGQRRFRPRGESQPTDLDQMLPNLRRAFAKELSQRCISWLPERVTDAIISGGGGEFFWPDLETLLNEAGLQVHLAAPSRLANVLGQHAYATAMVRASKRSA
ncbi:MAG: ParM/StbA family protein [Cyanobacteria bacterium P01_D01_bin.73]